MSKLTKLTKITATIGPASESEEMIEKLIHAGINVFRFNFKHNTIEWHNDRIQRVNKVAEKLGMAVGTLIDLQGPEIRINMPTDQIELRSGQKILFGEETFNQSPKVQGFSISHPDIIPYLTDGQKLLADDGAFTFRVKRSGKVCHLISESDGILKNRKSLNIPGADFPFPVLVDRDFEGLQLAVKNEIDYVALSFVRSADDLRVVRKEMQKYNVKAKLVSKIETQKAIDNLNEIINESDALMVARGDLGVELPIEQVPYHQKHLIRQCIEKGIPVITATQMLQSMVQNPYPTRAEISDVANATYDFTDSVMLSAETAAGAYPLETVNIMRKTIEYNEKKVLEDTRAKFKYQVQDQEEIICDAAYNVYLKSESSKIYQSFIVFTKTGRTAKLVSRYRPKIPIIALTPSKKVADNLTLYFGIYPMIAENVMTENSDVVHIDIVKTIDRLVELKFLTKGKQVIVLHGDIWGIVGGTSTIKIVKV